MPNLAAFIDESKAGPYLLSAVVIPVEALPTTRTALKKGRPNGHSRIHFRKDRDAVKKHFLGLIAELNVTSWIAIDAHPRERLARKLCFEKLIPELVKLGVREITIERDEVAIASDRQTLSSIVKLFDGLNVRFQHESAHNEPCLWIADATAWCYQRGGEWRRKINYKIIG